MAKKKFKITKEKIIAATGAVVLLIVMAGAGAFVWWLQNKDRITSDLDPIASAAERKSAVIKESEKLVDEGKVDEANKKLQDAVEQTNEPAEKQKFTIQQGVNYLNNGDYQKAVEYYLEAEKLAPPNYDTSHLLAESYEKLGDKEKAIEYYKKTIQTLPEDLAYKEDETNMLQNKIRELGGQP